METAVHTLRLLASQCVTLPGSPVSATAEVDWRQVVELARRGGVSGMIAAAVECREGAEVPQEEKRRLAAFSLMDEANNKRLMRECVRLCAAADAQGQALVPLKGASLLMGRPYVQLGVRSMLDLDLLVRRCELSKVEALLIEQGYRASDRREQAVRHEHHVRYRGPRKHGAVLVELHWTPFQALFSTLEQDESVFRNLMPVDYGGHQLLVLDDVDTLLSLLCHLAHHRFRGQLKWAADSAAFIEQTGEFFDWSLFWRRADALEARGAMTYALKVIGQLFKVPLELSPPLFHKLSWPMLDWLNPADDLLHGMAGLPPIWQRTITDVLLLDGPAATTRYMGFKVLELLERNLGHHMPRRWVRGKAIADG